MSYNLPMMPQLLTTAGCGLLVVYMFMKLGEVRGSGIVLVAAMVAIVAAFLLGAPYAYEMWTLQNITRMC
jgi:hypothetical protein